MRMRRDSGGYRIRSTHSHEIYKYVLKIIVISYLGGGETNGGKWNVKFIVCQWGKVV